MPSNSKSKSRSRSARSRAQARKSQQQNQNALIVGGVAIIAVIVIALFLLSRNGGSTSTGSSGATTPGAGAQFTPTPLIADDPTSPCYNATPPTTPAPANAPKQFSAPPQTIDPTHTYCAFLTTTHGVIVVELNAKSAPKHVNSFVFLAGQGYFDGITWHRVIPGFMAQTGDPTGSGSGGPGYTIPLEIDPALKYDRPGVLGMARTSDPNSAGSQFFITFGPTPSLDSGYTIFGRVVRGMSVLQQVAIRNVDQNPNVTLPTGDTLISVRTLDVTAGK